MPPQNVQALGEPGFGFQRQEQQQEQEGRVQTLERARELSRTMRNFNDSPVSSIEGSQGGKPVFSGTPGSPGGAPLDVPSTEVPAAAPAAEAGGAEALGGLAIPPIVP